MHQVGQPQVRPLRPIFHLTFWPSIKKVQVRAIVENINTETMQDVVADVAISAGGAQVFAQAAVPHYAGSRCDVHVDGDLLRFFIGDILVKTAARTSAGEVRNKRAFRTSAQA